MSTQQQILHVVGKLDGYGLSRQLELLVAQQLAAGQRVRVVALAAAPAAVLTPRQLGVDYRELDRRWRRDPFAAVRLASELRQAAIDIVHLWGQSALVYARTIRCFVRRTPILASLPHQTISSRRPIACISPGIKLPSSSNTSREQFLAEQRLPEDSILIAVAGPLTRKQQIDEAIWYFELVRTLDQRVRLLVFGDGPDRHRLERFSRLASEPSAIRFLGYRSDFRELLSHADLFWQTADGGEALPLTLLEAMAAGVPVVANDRPECRAIIDNGYNGFLVPDKDRATFARQTRKILHDERQADQLKVAAAATIDERFSSETMTQAYGNLYHELLNR